MGSVVLGVGVWLAADKASFIALLKMVENEHIEVSDWFLFWFTLKNIMNVTVMTNEFSAYLQTSPIYYYTMLV